MAVAEIKNKDHLLVRAARGEAIERVPVWAMRQAGRWDPEFHKIRSGLGFYDFSENVEKAPGSRLVKINTAENNSMVKVISITYFKIEKTSPNILELVKSPKVS